MQKNTSPSESNKSPTPNLPNINSNPDIYEKIRCFLSKLSTGSSRGLPPDPTAMMRNMKIASVQKFNVEDEWRKYKSAQIAKEGEADKPAIVAEVPKASVIAKAIEAVKPAKVDEAAEVAKVSEAVDVSEAAKVSEVSKSTEATKETEPTKEVNSDKPADSTKSTEAEGVVGEVVKDALEDENTEAASSLNNEKS